MKIVKGLDNLGRRFTNTVITLGNFDGVHIGHRRIFERVRAEAVASGGASVVVTFAPHPVSVMAPEREFKLLTPFDVKAELIASTGMDALVCIDFDAGFSAIKAEDFIRDVLVEKLSAARVIVGHNYRFGRGKKGTTELLRRRGARYGYGFSVVRNVKRGGLAVSSSRIRALLAHGGVRDANALLGRPYFVEGAVVTGAGRGRKLLGVPTANLAGPEELVPAAGVYAVRARLGKTLYNGVCNVGHCPTFGEGRLTCEVHLLGFDRMIVGQTLRVYFIEKLRPERKFSGAGELKAQIDADIEAAIGVLAKKRHTG
jgi:riboflavin kinase/FMN adenylyltransferase